MKNGPLKDLPIDLTRLMAMDSDRAGRLLQRVRDAALAGERPPVAPRPVIGASWSRVLDMGLDPGRPAGGGALLGRDELEHRRRSSALGDVLRSLGEALGGLVNASAQVMVVGDAEGRVLWRDGSLGALRRAGAICLEEGANWSERGIGTNAIGTALALRRPVQVHSAEHFAHALHSLTCAAAPVHDPRDGRLLGVIDVSGPAAGFHPTTLALVTSVARLAESELRERHGRSVDRLRSVAAPIMCRLGGRALAVDVHGWTAAVTGMAPVDRLPLPKSLRAGRIWQPSLGMCTVEPLPGGWLFRVDEEPRAEGVPGRVVLDLSRPGRRSVTVSGPAGSWTQELTPRHAELLYVLAAHRAGRSAAELAADVFGDPTRTVTVRAEMSRVRRHLSGVLAHRPYRFSEEVEVEVLAPERPADLLPRSTAPAVVSARDLPGP
ncbi:GAF domain-containing protein [Streptomyces sp. JV176]|uniref:GAF domain-containing protein n=1 Tax=Streptomyces sp. JV176 TaxID=858630 RepID=UPI002E794C7D|nr:GAF domain-containing protein [Streptomyces sp. JV176]MEE1803462.1 GAF domain-containing protein [Streptomyces sp. JV176]